MTTLQLVQNYRENKQLRESFFTLATKTFNLHFEEWYEKGFWGDSFKCFSIVDGSKVVANVSVSEVGLLIEGKSYKALQIGTVMTDPNYQGQGLSKQLMNALLAQYEEEIDIYYLFANETVLQFYTKFGFEKRSQSTYTVDANSVAKGEASFRKLEMNNDDDLAFLYYIVKSRTPISQTFTTENAADLVMFHSLFSYRDHIYYNKELDTVVMYKQSEEAVIVYDVISKNAVPLLDVLATLKTQAVKKFELCFTPNDDVPYDKGEFIDTGALFVKCRAGADYPNNVLYPYTSLA
ncbi:GNAT family N-acetyltransferase [Solibacillus sp. CAU 1738]|uniref:GNAT family N-acetyltransferase n=1 Tax=Solibacillus sp. CAU 1738 TaxID=3140363 RepID=UPI0032611C34